MGRLQANQESTTKPKGTSFVQTSPNKLKNPLRRFMILRIILLFLYSTSTQAKFKLQDQDHGPSLSAELRICTQNSKGSIVQTFLKKEIDYRFDVKTMQPTTKKFIQDSSSVPQYVLLERGGSTCYKPDPAYKGPLFIALIIFPHGQQPGKCIVKNILTNSHLIPCASGETPISQILSIQGSTYDLINSDSLVKFDENFNFNNVKTMNRLNFHTETPLTLAFFDDEFVEYLITNPLRGESKSLSDSFYLDRFNEIREGYFQRHGIVIKPSTYIKRNTYDSLRGFYFVPDPNDKFGEFNKIEGVGTLLYSRTLYVQLYIQKPYLMTEDDILVLQFDTSQKVAPDGPYINKRFNYMFKIQRVTSHSKFEFTLSRAGSPNEKVKLEMPYIGGSNKDWVHIIFSMGHAALYQIDDTTLFCRRTESIISWFGGIRYSKTLRDFTETDSVDSIYHENWHQRQMIVTLRMQAYSDKEMTSPVLTNDFGLRMFHLGSLFGVFIPDDIAISSGLPDNRCLMHRFEAGGCLAHVFLTNENDSNEYGVDNFFYKPREAGCPHSECRYCKRGYICMFAKEGVNEDLYFADHYPFIKERWPEMKYDPSKPEIALRFKKVVNNQGREYWTRCPMDCKKN